MSQPNESPTTFQGCLLVVQRTVTPVVAHTTYRCITATTFSGLKEEDNITTLSLQLDGIVSAVLSSHQRTPEFLYLVAMVLLMVVPTSRSAPTSSGSTQSSRTPPAVEQQPPFEDVVGPGDEQRTNKALQYFQYLQPPFSGEGDYFSDAWNHYEPTQDGENEVLSRTEPLLHRKPLGSYPDSPIYYIRLPPTPYMYVPGLGYVSQPPPPPSQSMNPFINLPVNFLANGKPTTIYQWSSGAQEELEDYQRPELTTTSTPRPALSSSIINLNKGPYNFNGKPSDIFVLRNSYNSLYADALQNFYP
uniref:Uncharacterized protein n=1 Tax=Timema shepardi TaxID=629360 RepID=A0A7R9FV06_TIMSH|nr:unnamed protein product [Timema shepardi]